MLCDKCTTIINDKYNKVCYSCGHRYHRTCLLLKKYSLLNPSCSICDDGKIIRNRYIQYDSVVNLEEVVKDLEVVVKDLEEVKDIEVVNEGTVASLEIVRSSKILCIIFCTIYLFILI